MLFLANERSLLNLTEDGGSNIVKLFSIFVNGARTKCVKQMMIYSGMVDNLDPKIDADLISRLATDVSAGVHHLAR